MINNHLKTEIKKHALEQPDKEVCGLILVSGDQTFIYKCKNVATNPSRYFELSSLDYIRAWQEGKNHIVGFYHSQKSPIPSMVDVINFNNHKIPSYIYSFDIDEVFEVSGSYLQYKKYLGRPFEIGVTDCFSLVRDFYKEERGIEIFNYPRHDGWYEENPDIIMDNYKKEGFINVKLENVMHGDVVEFHRYHFGIYLSGDFLLHHPRSKYSVIEIFGDHLKKRATNIYRHE